MFDDPTARPSQSRELARLLTLPSVLMALLGDETPFNVSLYRDRRQGDVWWFRFSNRAILRLAADGDHAWRNTHERVRTVVDPLIAEARAIVSERDRQVSGSHRA